ncbi:hypothetical protein ACHAPJ_006276 [Fusarium lateritium]
MAASTFKLKSVSLKLRFLPPDIYLVHATNCVGEWAVGATELRYCFKDAWEIYKEHCRAARTDPDDPWSSQSLVGTCFIIPPQDSYAAAGMPRVHIVCLFTSYGYGSFKNLRTGRPAKDDPSKILAQTRVALGEMRTQLEAQKNKPSGEPETSQPESEPETSQPESEPETSQPADNTITIYSPKINSGASHVSWKLTSSLIEEVFEGWDGHWFILSTPNDME